MGLFKRAGKAPLTPDGRPIACESESERRKTFTFTPERRSREGIPPVDTTSSLEAGYARMLGLPDDEPLLAWGDLLLEWPPQGNAMRPVEGVVSANWCFTWWKERRRLDGLILNFSTSTAISQIQSAPVFRASFGDALFMGPSGQQMTGPVTVAISATDGVDDGHAARRSLEAVYTFAQRAIDVGQLS